MAHRRVYGATPDDSSSMGFGLVFLGVISLSSLHWERWAIQVLPLVVLFGVSAVVTFARFAARSVRSCELRRWVLVGVVVVGTVAIVAEPAISLVDDERMQVQPSTRELMRSWIIAHVPVGTPIATEVKGPELRTAGYPVLDRYDLPTDGTLGDYAAHGYHYLIVNAFVSLRYRIDAKQFPHHARFYEFLRERGDLLAAVRRHRRHDRPAPQALLHGSDDSRGPAQAEERRGHEPLGARSPGAPEAALPRWRGNPRQPAAAERARFRGAEARYAELDRRAAGGTPGDDLIGGFITAEVDGERLTREDVIDIMHSGLRPGSRAGRGLQQRRDSQRRPAAAGVHASLNKSG